MTSSNTPQRKSPDCQWEHFNVFERVKEAILSLPYYFKTDTYIEGITATDIFTLNSALGATIEHQVVETLNSMRQVWDPDERYRSYAFVRQSQTFPDVILKKNSASNSGAEIIMGIELKGWYLLAKEGEPSFRFQATPAACAMADIIVVVPWVLNNVMSGSPRVLIPYIESSKFAAEFRNYHWTTLRTAKAENGVTLAQNVSPYPKKSDQISDKAVSDNGGNFGRFARTGLMDNYIKEIFQSEVCGIEALHWHTFFKIFQEQRNSEDIRSKITALKTKILVSSESQSDEEDLLQKILLLIESHYN